MAIDFPASPAANEIYEENDLSWQWNGTSWDALVDAYTAPPISLGAGSEDYLSVSGSEISGNAIDLDNLSATGTPSATTFLRGDNAWATPAGGGASNTDMGLAVSDESTALTASTSTPLGTLHAQNAGTWSEILIGVTTAPTGSTLTCDVHLNGTTIFSTKPTIDAGAKTSVTAVTAAVLSTTTYAKGDLIELFCDSVGATVAGTGLKFYFNQS